ncbi:hypothetical protein [Aeromonas jandaei]|uniref:hypothetical protein n=1 Tax=Aeromonas jandaei TaxID=650 RepID=UPI001ADDC90F|nr:hypothetical protein [Aeromonas jandaei]
MKKNVIALMVASMMGATAAYALESSPTAPVVGFKPVYQNTTGTGAITGDLIPGATLAVDPTLLNFYDEDGDAHDVAAVQFSWTLDGNVVSTTNSFTIPTGSAAVGKAVTLSVTPVTVLGDPLQGDALVLTNLTAAGVPGGDAQGNVGTSTTAQPIVSNLEMSGSLLVGGQLAATYVFDANGGDATDASTYAWGHQGATAAGVGVNAVTTSGSVPAYTIVATDAGEVMEVSVQAQNGLALTGNTETVDANNSGNVTGGQPDGGGNIVVPFLKLEPTAVAITFTSTATDALNGVAGVRPVAAKDLMTADFTPDVGASSDPADYTFEWKVNGVAVGAPTAGANTFTPGVAHQGQPVSVDVQPTP